MNKITDREKRDIQRIIADRDYFSLLPAKNRTAAVSTVAVLSSSQNLEYVPEAVINRSICRAAFLAKDADSSVLSYIPYPDVQKEGIKRLSAREPAFVLYSFADIQDAQMAQEAVKADAYCIQLVPDNLLTKELCRTALKSPGSDEKVSKFVTERYPELKIIEDKHQKKPSAGIKF